MAATAAQVKAITGSTLDDAVIDPFIVAADCILLQISECMAALTDACQDQVAVYLAAHLLTSSTVGQASATVSKESLRGKYTVEYLRPSATGQGLLGTTYGATANSMTGGCLMQLDKNPINMFSIGSIGC